MNLKFDPYQFTTTQSNGVPVFWKNIPWANGFVYVRILFRVGARHDPIGKEGLAHFLEHMPFNGCTEWPTLEAIEGVGRALFNQTLNASTSREKTEYSAKVSIDRLHEALCFMRSFLFSPLFDPKEVERERNVITREIWRRYDSELKSDLEKHIRKITYGEHVFARSECALGWHDTVATISHDDIVKFYSDYYHRGNMKIILVGDVEEHHINQLEVLTQSVPIGNPVPPPEPHSWEKPPVAESIMSMGEYFKLNGNGLPNDTSINVVRLTPNIENNEQFIITSNLLRQILFDRIRGDMGSAYSPSVSGVPYRDHVYTSISVSIPPQQLEKIRAIISSSISEIARRDKRHAGLFDEVHAACLQNKRHLDLSAEQITRGAVSKIVEIGRVKPVEEDCGYLEKVTYDDIGAWFEKEFSPEKLFWNIFTP